MSKSKSFTFENIIAMNLIGLGVLSAAVGAQAISEIPAMTKAIAESGKRLKPMPEVITFDKALEVVRK